MSDTYSVRTWDHEEDDWQVEFSGLTKWQIRSALRELYGCGWTDLSIQVKAETHDRPAARWGRGFCAGTSTAKQRKEWRAMRRRADARQRERLPLFMEPKEALK